MIKYSKPRQFNYSSRYGKYRVITDNSSYIETFNQTTIDKSDNDKYHIVLPEQENRIDMIAYQYYHDASLSWVILLANEIIDPFIIKAGTTIRIPSIMSLYKNGGALYKNG